MKCRCGGFLIAQHEKVSGLCGCCYLTQEVLTGIKLAQEIFQNLEDDTQRQVVFQEFRQKHLSGKRNLN